jgi:hypothetical protein
MKGDRERSGDFLGFLLSITTFKSVMVIIIVSLYLIGVHRKGSKITVNGQDADRADEWLTIQGLNRPGVDPESLYEAQVAGHKKQEPKLK